MTIITNSQILSPAVDGSAFYPRIGYKNLFRDGTVTVSSSAAGSAETNAYDGFTYSAWRSIAGGEQWIAVEVDPAQSCDYMAVAAHTLAGCDLTPQYSNDGSTWTDLAAQFKPPSNAPIVWEFAAVTAAHFRLLIENAPAAISISAIHVGAKLTIQRGLPVGWEPPSLNEDIRFTNTICEGGQTLGRNIISRGASVRVETNPATWEFARGEWSDFLQVANSIACFFWWRYDDYAEIIYGGMIEQDAQFSGVNFLSVSFRLQGINR